jgi:acetyltransferase
MKLPYPTELEEAVTLCSGRPVTLRPIRPEDEPQHLELFRSFSPEDMHFRFFGLRRDMPHSELVRYTDIDYDREMAFIATITDEDGRARTLGVVRVALLPDGETAEFAVIVRSDIKGEGLGHALMTKVIRYCRERGLRYVIGEVLPDNGPMLELAKALGFTRQLDPRAGVMVVRLTL